ncbi:MAG: glycosyltransferase family 4 protein [Lachnospiraceae bacterium]|nr:glycosyltransferase family 4 protein [Lachnospiraceae bacterium]
MKVLVIHNFHRKGSASGDDQVYKNETALLEDNGVDVIKYTVINDSFDNSNVFEKVAATFGMLWSFKHYYSVKKVIKREHPDIVHIHTFFPLLSPSILYAGKRAGCKVIATLHDTRFICPCATSLRERTLCNECGDGKYFRMFKYKCFKGSRFQSLIVAFIFKYHRIRKTFYRQIDKYICLNDNQIKLLRDIGFDENKIVKKYNFVKDSVEILEEKQVELPKLPERYVVYFGRLGEEKGIHVLMSAWEDLDDIPIVVMGAGPLEEEFNAWAQDKKQVICLGHTEHSKCMKIVTNSEFVFFPSVCYEGCSMVVIEAESLSKPIVATDLGFASEAIIDDYNGVKVKLNDVEGFKNAVRMLWSDTSKCRQMGKNARMDYENKYTLERNFKQLEAIYNNKIEL